MCKNCGHIQLSKFISPELLYNNIYANRTSESYLSDNAIKYFKNFLFKTLKRKKNEGILEIGCNDIKLINNLKDNFNILYGIDPIWKKRKTPSTKKIKVIGDYVEKVNLNKITGKINAVVSTHNLEHIDDPYKVLKRFLNKLDKDTIFFIEVPDADLMVKNCRFDQIFHQHYHYFNLNSLENLANRLGCRIINKSINYNFWGGSLMVAFKKDKIKKIKIKNNYKSFNKKIKINYLKFKNHYNKMSLKFYNQKNLIGYGAGQMVPSFAYHLKSNLSFLKFIIDDNKNRQKQKYPFIEPKIKYFDKNLIDNKVLITALDGVKSISKKLKNLKIEHFNPLVK